MMTTMMVESSLAVGFRTSTTSVGYRHHWSSGEVSGVHFATGRVFQASVVDVHRNRVPRLIDGYSFVARTGLLKSRIRVRVAAGEDSDSMEWNGESDYHPSEGIGESVSVNNEDATLTPAETGRTIIEVNNKGTLMFSGLVDDHIRENIFWPDLPYLTDEHGNIYFEVNEEEDILQTLTSEENPVQVIIGLDTKEMLSDMEVGSLGMEEIADEYSDGDGDADDVDGDEETDEDDGDDFEDDWVSVLDSDEEEYDSDETLGDWAKLDTMRSSHPMYFARKMADVTSDVPMAWMDQPPAGIAIQGLLKSALIEENSIIRKQKPDHQSSSDDTNEVGTVEGDQEDISINGHEPTPRSPKDGSNQTDDLGKDENLRVGTSFYKLEMTKIQLLSANGNQVVVELEDFQKAQPDVIAHSAANILSRLKAGGEKTTQALKLLCWRVKGIQVEEAAVIGVDSLGFDLRVCSGTQVQTLRFAFNSRATSEYSAERQFHDLMFPRIHQTPQKPQEAGQKDS